MAQFYDYEEQHVIRNQILHSHYSESAFTSAEESNSFAFYSLSLKKSTVTAFKYIDNVHSTFYVKITENTTVGNNHLKFWHKTYESANQIKCQNFDLGP